MLPARRKMMNGDIAVFNERTEVSFDDRQVRIDGHLKGELSPLQAALLKSLVETRPAVLSYDRIGGTIMIEDEEKERKLSVARRVSKEIVTINKMCGFTNNVEIKNIRGTGYQISQAVKVRVIRRNHLETVDTGTFFIREKGYIEPTLWLNSLYDDAYRNARVHVISGERGIGKSSLAKQFAVNACRNIRYAWKPFKSVMFVTYTDNSLRRTLESLRCIGSKNELVSYEQKLTWLEEMPKPVLLIIDNYDNEEMWRDELTESSETYQDLLTTGCHVLITSRVDLSAGYALEQTRLDHLPLESLVKLFCALAENINYSNDRQKVSDFIEKYLRSNTYLVRLAAGLTKTKRLDTIIGAFRNASVGTIKEPVSGRDQMIGSVMELFSMLYDMTAIEADPVKRKLLYNLALLPIEGMDYETFLGMAYGEADEGVLEARASLTESFWIFLKNYRLSLHPLVKEMILRRKESFVYSDVEIYIRHLNERVLTETYYTSLADDLVIAEAAFAALIDLEADRRDMAYLMANIVSGYDLLADKPKIAFYGPIAIDALDDIDGDLAEADIKDMAIYYNVVGYALLHIQGDERVKRSAEHAIERSAELISQLDQSDYQVLRLYTVNKGNHAAKAIVRGDYYKAYEIHKENKDLRFKMSEIEDTTDIRQLIGGSYKGMGTACYYLARQFPDKREDYLRDAFQNHQKAVSFYEKAYGKDSRHPDLAVARIRWAGAGRALIEIEGIEAEQALGKEICAALKEAVLAVLTMEAVNVGEVRNALDHYVALTVLFKEAGLLDTALIKDSDLIIRAVRTKLTGRTDIEGRLGRLEAIVFSAGKEELKRRS